MRPSGLGHLSGALTQIKEQSENHVEAPLPNMADDHAEDPLYPQNMAAPEVEPVIEDVQQIVQDVNNLDALQSRIKTIELQILELGQRQHSQTIQNVSGCIVQDLGEELW